MEISVAKIKRNFKTPIGSVCCGLIGEYINFKKVDEKTYEHGSSAIYQSESCKIELIEFRIRLPLYNGGNVDDSCGWIWRIEKNSENVEQIEIFCMLNEYSDSVEFDSANGESLEAIEASNSEWMLHIGTEDGEIMNQRAENNDWFPERLKAEVDFYNSITSGNKDGFLTKLPLLRKGEKIHIQYISAFERNGGSKGNSWLAVDVYKRDLENWIGLW